MKKCRICSNTLDIHNSTYYRLRNYIYLCNDCDRDEKRKWAANNYKKNPSKSAKKSLDWSHKNSLVNPIKNKCNQMSASSYKRAKILNIPYNINSAYLFSIAPSICPVL